MGKRRLNRERATPHLIPNRSSRARTAGADFEPARQRVVTLVGHRAAGKTSLGDLCLLYTSDAADE